MPGIRGAGSLLLIAALATALYAERPIAEFSPLEVAAMMGLGGICLYMASFIVEGFTRHWTYGVQAVAASGGLLMAILVVYTSQEELGTALDRVIGDISSGRVVSTPQGEVIARRTDGSFIIRGEVNGEGTRFVFDTGASAVVLRAESAADFGFNLEELDYSIPVTTANGMSLAAPVTIDTLTVGSIEERKIRALIARTGLLHANLLGMTFLERLNSYEVRGNRLILRGRHRPGQSQ